MYLQSTWEKQKKGTHFTRFYDLIWQETNRPYQLLSGIYELRNKLITVSEKLHYKNTVNFRIDERCLSFLLFLKFSKSAPEFFPIPS